MVTEGVAANIIGYANGMQPTGGVAWLSACFPPGKKIGQDALGTCLRLSEVLQPLVHPLWTRGAFGVAANHEGCSQRI